MISWSCLFFKHETCFRGAISEHKTSFRGAISEYKTCFRGAFSEHKTCFRGAMSEYKTFSKTHSGRDEYRWTWATCEFCLSFSCINSFPRLIYPLNRLNVNGVKLLCSHYQFRLCHSLSDWSIRSVLEKRHSVFVHLVFVVLFIKGIPRQIYSSQALTAGTSVSLDSRLKPPRNRIPMGRHTLMS